MTIEQRPWAVDLVASQNKIAPALVRKAKNDFATWQQQVAQQQAAAQAAAVGGMPAKAQGPPAPEQPSAMVDSLLQSMSPQ